MKARLALLARVAVMVTVMLAPSRIASAQLRGHYVPGFTGLENGGQSPPGIGLALQYWVYPTGTIMDDDGGPLGSFDGGQPKITSSFLGIGMLWVTSIKLFGGNLGGQFFPIDFAKSRIEANSLEVSGSFAFTDIYVQPLWLGWSTPRADYSAGWGFFAPTGKWELGGDENTGFGMWSNDFQAGATVRLDERRNWTTSVLTTYEIHSSKKDSDLEVGDILTFEGGTGRSFSNESEGSVIVSAGIAYYAQLKVTSDTGTGPITVDFAGKDRVFGIGPEASVFLPKSNLLLDLRVVPEFGARNRTQGLTIVFTAGYQM